ncbi:LytTR family DNA-binding domain-containing protein [Hyphobacterium sp. HN65]|uniref:LytTR family DNA-binding domain-containing protein n=1 Tax=Hyphobacterium lacteum TaxID=3116575 RepID=A0ABU7LTE7_9PROT|nr:LytTR family DNA-binding domain-containing protein [Hyphobacterium sp. HN65]MEE2526921.1 LytTR family DNA-binding domain-containing protein [Hyphobacterium sp. HN65]
MTLGFQSRYVNGAAGTVDRVNEFLKTHGGRLVFLGGTGTFLTLISPLDTDALPFLWRWTYWVGLLFLGGGAGELSERLLTRLAPGLSTFPRYALITAMVSVPVTLAVIAIQAAVGPMPSLLQIPIYYFFVFVISAGVSTLTWMLERPDQTTNGTGPGRALTDKLPVRLRTADLLALESEDHYLRVHTSRGDALILMRLSDAMAAAESLEGAQTHRSWWVARAAIDHAEKAGGRAELTLTNGLKAPVSRSFYADLRDKGWI